MQRKNNYHPLKILIFIICISAILFSCRKNNIITDSSAKINFSTDTLKFDTVFTTAGSATRSFKIYNPYNESIIVSSINLAGGEPSMFRMNVDGSPGVLFSDIEIPPNDSIYIFVEITIDPNADALPFIIEDSVLFITNGNEQKVLLTAWGQNAHFFDGQTISNDTTWTNDLPYVIINSMLVDSLKTLTIEKGCRIYVHGNSAIYVLGTLRVKGVADSTVTFQGDRLEFPFRDVPGQWDGIFFLRNSKANEITFSTIKNANTAITLGYSTNPDLATYYGPTYRPELIISNSSIFDCQVNGIFSINSKIDATNCLIYNIGQVNVALTGGGYYDFKFCTFANYGSQYLTHGDPVFVLEDFFDFTPSDFILKDVIEHCDVVNTIIEGSVAEGKEIVLLSEADSLTTFNYNFNYCVLRTNLDAATHNFTNSILNVDAAFTDINNRNYIPSQFSPAVNAGIDIGVGVDILDNIRPYSGTLPDIGAYETFVE